MKKYIHNIKMYILICVVAITSMLLMAASSPSYSEAVLDYIDTCSNIKNLCRTIGYAGLKGMAQLLDGIYQAVTHLLTLDFLRDIPGIAQLYTTMTPIAWVVLSVSIIALGIMIMAFHDKMHVSEGLKNLLLAVLLIVGMPTVITTFEEFKTASVTDMNSQLSQIGGGQPSTSSDTVGQALLKSIIVDLENTQTANQVKMTNKNPYRIKVNEVFPTGSSSIWNFKIAEHSTLDELKEDVAHEVFGVSPIGVADLQRRVNMYEATGNIQAIIDINEEIYSNTKNMSVRHIVEIEDLNQDGYIDYSSSSDPETAEVKYEGKETFYSLMRIYNDKINEISSAYSALTIDGMTFFTEKLENPSFDIKEQIYCYQPNFLFGYLIVGISIIAMIFAGFKIAALLFDVLFNQIITPIALATDVTGSGRGKKMLQNLISSYIVFMMILLLLKIYLEITTWAASSDFGLGDNIVLIVVIRILIIGGAAKGMIDGPDIIPQILGVDAGIKSGMGAALATLGVAKAAGGVAKGVASAPFKAGMAAKRLSQMPHNHRKNAVDRADTKAAYSQLKSGQRGSSGGGSSGAAALADTGTSSGGGGSSAGVTANSSSHAALNRPKFTGSPTASGNTAARQAGTASTAVPHNNSRNAVVASGEVSSVSSHNSGGSADGVNGGAVGSAASGNMATPHYQSGGGKTYRTTKPLPPVNSSSSAVNQNSSPSGGGSFGGGTVPSGSPSGSVASSHMQSSAKTFHPDRTLPSVGSPGHSSADVTHTQATPVNAVQNHASSSNTYSGGISAVSTPVHTPTQAVSMTAVPAAASAPSITAPQAVVSNASVQAASTNVVSNAAVPQAVVSNTPVATTQAVNTVQSNIPSSAVSSSTPSAPVMQSANNMQSVSQSTMTTSGRSVSLITSERSEASIVNDNSPTAVQALAESAKEKRNIKKKYRKKGGRK